MTHTTIKFGTSGWRAVIAEDFNVFNLRRVAHAVSAHIKDHPEYGIKGEEYLLALQKQPKGILKGRHVVIGYDTRYLSEEFAKQAAEVFAFKGISVLISNTEAPTPVIAWMVMKNHAVGGVTITASHNPGHYNGFKWTPFWGGPAIPEITDDIEARVLSISPQETEKILPFEQGTSAGIIKVADFHEDYFKQIFSILDARILKNSRLKTAVDSVYGTARTYLGPVLEKLGLKPIRIHEERDVMFNGSSPNTDEENLAQLKQIVLKNRLDLGLACDGDADRFGIIDSDGTWISPNLVLGILIEHLVKNKGLKGKVARSVMTSHFADAVAKYHGLEVRETPVGFKYIGNLLRTGQYLIGGEESAGLSMKGHVPEKDGILACLLVAEMAACERKPLKKIISDINRKVGNFVNQRINLHLDEKVNIANIIEKLKTRPPLNIAGSSVWRIDHTDGFKFILKDGSWLGLRPSGTEPIVRIYAEADDAVKMKNLVEAGKKIITGKF
ncbi:MAG: phosphoglucomutase/phosphomannomutase family protein [Elusimicrobia bacterium]|nr:phosphoglucomutase/phosphomannomutase family protein [Elusimicrobiota bacterium]